MSFIGNDFQGARSMQIAPGPGVPLGTRRLDLTRPSGTPAGTAARRFFRGVAMPATWASVIAFSPDRPAKRPVGALRCLQVPLGTRTGPDGRENSSSGAPPGARLRRSLRSEAARCKASRNCSAKQRGPFPRKQPPYRGGPDASHSGGPHCVFYCQPLP